MTKEVIARVTRKGQVTIPADFRKLHKITEGGRICFRDSSVGLVLEPMPNIEDLAGVDSKKISYKEASKRLDSMRAEDRY